MDNELNKMKCCFCKHWGDKVSGEIWQYCKQQKKETSKDDYCGLFKPVFKDIAFKSTIKEHNNS